MLTFLWVASRRGFAIASYVDVAVGTMTKNDRGKAWVSKVTLDNCRGARGGYCFIANSVKTEILVK